MPPKRDTSSKGHAPAPFQALRKDLEGISLEDSVQHVDYEYKDIVKHVSINSKSPSFVGSILTPAEVITIAFDEIVIKDLLQYIQELAALFHVHLSSCGTKVEGLAERSVKLYSFYRFLANLTFLFDPEEFPVLSK